MVEEANHWAKGSSPLARGLLTTAENAALGAGIIPARAGFTAMNVFNRPPKKDHPRSRGVYVPCVTWGEWLQGSSPLARGLRGAGGEGEALRGIIPARAGFTVEGLVDEAAPRDHPRSRGVYAAFVAASWAAVGSSPLARGLRAGAQARPVGRRIIPARAGFTMAVAMTRGRCPDHPRSRGVYVVRHERAVVLEGSSPLARGLRPPEVGPRREPRIIPARAGFTSSPSRPPLSLRDHPRSRGVYLFSVEAVA